MRMLVLLGAVTLSAPAAACIHAAIGADGRLQVATDAQPGLRRFDPLQAQRPPLPSAPRTPSHARQYTRLIADTARQRGVDAALLHAVVQVESGYDARARSRTGAAGLMQLMPATAERFGVRDRFDPAQNLHGGSLYLLWLMERFNGDLELVLAAYNAGEGAVQRHGNRIPPYPETRAYVRRVLALYPR